jgi:cyclopropane-fatty-acyl-phospholipid synthase
MMTQPHPKSRSLSKILAKSQTVDLWCRKILFDKLKNIKHGHLSFIDQSQTFDFGDKNSSLKAIISIHRQSFYSRSLLGGSIGNAESYVDQDWDVDHLTHLVRIFVRNRELLENIDGGIGSLLRPIQRYFHGLRSNTLDGSKENIRAHYDIGNDFFSLFLDPTMMYSSAIFETPDQSLENASLNKIRTICEKLNLKPTDHLVDIGTGWGSLAIYAAQNYHCKVTTTTISQEQFNYAKKQIEKFGLEDRITLLLEDYRLLEGSYDKLVSVEMIEAVGLEHLPVYFEKCSSLLKPNGLMVLQAITIRDQFYLNAKKNVDFIQRHIFPGSGIPSLHAMLNCVRDKTDLSLIDQHDFAEDYAQTLHHWSINLKQVEAQVLKLGYPDFLPRLWQFYFSYCEGGFRERAIGVSQMVLSKPVYRDRSYV